MQTSETCLSPTLLPNLMWKFWGYKIWKWVYLLLARKLSTIFKSSTCKCCDLKIVDLPLKLFPQYSLMFTCLKGCAYGNAHIVCLPGARSNWFPQPCIQIMKFSLLLAVYYWTLLLPVASKELVVVVVVFFNFALIVSLAIFVGAVTWWLVSLSYLNSVIMLV